jgi:DNA-binding SARP family transcriptional activator
MVTNLVELDGGLSRAACIEGAAHSGTGKGIMARDLSPDVKSKVAEYGSLPSVWEPRPVPPKRFWRERLGAVAGAARSAVTVGLLLVGVPAAMWWAFGDPTDRLPTGRQVLDWLEQPGSRFTETVLAGVALWAGWLLWAVLALLTLADLIFLATRMRLPVLRLPAPLHRLAFGLAGTAAIALGTAGRTGVAPAVQAPAGGQSSDPPAFGPETPAHGQATILVGQDRYTYVVKRRDSLSKIARAWLGDPDRWPEICRLNKHRHFPAVGGTLRDCDLIYPGWDLRLPADAKPPAGANPLPRRPPPARPRTAPEAVPAPTPAPTSEPAAPVEPDSVIPEPRSPTPPTPTTSPSRSPSLLSPWPSRSGAPAPASTDRGVELAGGFVPWALAAAVTAAAALVWLHRRRQHRPGDDIPDVDLPQPVADVHRHVLRQPDLAVPADLAERAAAVPDLPLPAPGGAGLIGEGAPAAARAALVSALAAGGPADPDRRAEAVIDTATWTVLFGDLPAPADWPRLHIATDLDHALTLLDARILHRSRVHDTDDSLDVTRVHPQDIDAGSPLLLICQAPPGRTAQRLQHTLHLGGDIGIRAALLGHWPHGATTEITPEGYVTSADASPGSGSGDRLAVLDAESAAAILATLHEAHTGQPPPALSTGATTVETGETRPAAHRPAEPPATRAQVAKVGLRVLGGPHIENVTRPGRPLRAKAAELAVFLACHPDGADTATVAEHLTPDARLHSATQQVHTNASNLRHVLGRAGGPIRGGYLLKQGAASRYRLDPAAVDVDLWRLRDLIAQARLAAPPQRTELLREACDLYTAPLADGCHYDWVEPHRETARRWATEAHLLLAEDLLASRGPHAATTILTKAIGLDRYNEELYRAAMRARHAEGDLDSIGYLLRALTKALRDLDVEPAAETTDLATRLRKTPPVSTGD